MEKLLFSINITSLHFISEYSQSLLAHPHLWVRLAAAQLIGFILATLDVDKVVELLNNPESDTIQGYMYSKPVDTLKSLILDLVAQLYPDMTFEQLADQVVKNLIFIAKMLKSVTGSVVKNDEKDDGNKTKDSNRLSFPWLIRRLRKAVNIEITQAPKSTSVVSTSSFIYVSMKSFIDTYFISEDKLCERYIFRELQCLSSLRV